MTNEDREYYEIFADGEFWDALFSVLDSELGYSATTLLIGVPLILALYSWSETVIMPAIVLALFGGTLIAYAPPQVAFIGTLLVVSAVTIVLASIWSEQ